MSIKNSSDSEKLALLEDRIFALEQIRDKTPEQIAEYKALIMEHSHLLIKADYRKTKRSNR